VADLITLPSQTRVFVDTIVFSLHFGGRSATCSAFVTRIARGDIKAYVNAQVLSDLIHKLMLAEACTKGFINNRKASELRALLENNRSVAASLIDYQHQFESLINIGIRVLPITRKLLIETKAERRAHGLMTSDSLHLGNMNRLENPILDIATYDRDFSHIPNINSWEPMDVI